MTYLAQLKSKLESRWNSGEVLLDSLSEESMYPLRIKLSTLVSDTEKTAGGQMRALGDQVLDLEKYCQKNTFEIESASKKIFAAKQILPAYILIPSVESHCLALKKTSEYSEFHDLLASVQQRLPHAYNYYKNSWRWVKNNPIDARKLFETVLWRYMNPDVRCFVRQAQSENVDTKFLESPGIQTRFLKLIEEVMDAEWLQQRQNLLWPENGGFKARDTTRIRFRFLSPADSPFPSRITNIEVLFSQLNEELFSKIHSFIVIENETTIEALPEISGVAVIYGKGKGIAALDLSVFSTWGKKLFYFGDIDIDGMHCLSLARITAPDIESLLMDVETFTKYSEKFGVYHQATKIPTNLGDKLTGAENKVLHLLLDSTRMHRVNRLEQEKLPFDLVYNTISNLK
jgi:hypothetical protein